MRELWFIITLFWLFLFTPFWRLVLKNIWLESGCIILLLALLWGRPDIKIMCIGDVCSYAIWFYLGILISKEDIVGLVFNKNVWLTMISGVGIYILGLYIHPSITTAGGIVFSFGFALMTDKYYPQMFCTFRKYTYQIFLMGIFAQIFIKLLHNHYGGSYALMYILCVLSGIYVPVLISIIAKKMAHKSLLLCLGLK